MKKTQGCDEYIAKTTEYKGLKQRELEVYKELELLGADIDFNSLSNEDLEVLKDNWVITARAKELEETISKRQGEETRHKVLEDITCLTEEQKESFNAVLQGSRGKILNKRKLLRLGCVGDKVNLPELLEHLVEKGVCERKYSFKCECGEMLDTRWVTDAEIALYRRFLEIGDKKPSARTEEEEQFLEEFELSLFFDCSNAAYCEGFEVYYRDEFEKLVSRAAVEYMVVG